LTSTHLLRSVEESGESADGPPLDRARCQRVQADVVIAAGRSIWTRPAAGEAVKARLAELEVIGLGLNDDPLTILECHPEIVSDMSP
jgi:hypothetical protein